MILAALREMVKQMAAVGVEQCVSNVHGVSAAERVDLRLIDDLGVPADRPLSLVS